jgi:uncharacterized protein (TIGR03000 family)
MYSVVLMAALAAGGQTPEWGFRGGNHYACADYSCWHGGGYGSCYGCFGGGYGAYGGYGDFSCCGYGGVGYATFGCHGCYGCYGCYGCAGYAPGVYPGVAPGLPPPGAGGDVLPPPKKEGETLAPNRARLIVELPPDALLYVDDQPTKATAERRVFQTPDLEKGQAYYYDLRIEAMRDGKPFSENRRVVVRPGEEVLADFKNPAATATAKAP